MDEERWGKFFEALVQIDDRSECYLQHLCDMVLRFTGDRAHPVAQYAAQMLAGREEIEAPYWRLIAAAGNTSVNARLRVLQSV